MIIGMLDAESLGLTPDSVVTQIALCVYDLANDKVVNELCWWPDLAEQRDRVIDPTTVAWWMQQEREAQNGVFRPPAVTYKANILQQMRTATERISVWAKPAMFDLPLLTSYFGVKPWSYRDERDMQTLVRLCDPINSLQPDISGTTAHDARSDALWQARYLARIYHATGGFNPKSATN